MTSQDAELIAPDLNLAMRKIVELQDAEIRALRSMERAIKQRDALSKENERLKAWLNEALEGWEEGSNYKGDYLKAKHGDADDIARIRAALEQTDAKGTGDTPSRDVYGSD